MKNYFLDISPKQNSGFCNQIYSIIYTCGHCVRNSINFIFVGKFLEQIQSQRFCNISEIIDIDATNNYLKQYQLCLVDYYNFDFKIVSAKYGVNNTCIDVTEHIKQFLNNRVFYISKTWDLNSLFGNPAELYKTKYFIDLDKRALKLDITFSINNIIFSGIYDQTDGFLKTDLLIDLNNVTFQPSLLIQNDQTEFTKGIFRNIVFQGQFLQKAAEYITPIREKYKNINCIHLRLEEDAVEHWARENKMSPMDFKRIIEDKYIDAITRNLKKEDATLILSDNYDNRVIHFLRENGYYFIETQKMRKDREVAAIYDLHIGQYCNNVYILVYDSSFSYTLLYRIYEQTRFKPVELNYILNQRCLPA
jgi:hypothetical protein